MNERKLTNVELRDLLIENCLDKNGDLVFCNIDLSEFKGKVYLTGWKVGGSADLSYWDVKGNLYQNCQTVNGNLYQDCQTAKNIYQYSQIVTGDLDQNSQTVNGNLYQRCQIVNGNIYQGCQEVKGNLDQSCQNVSKDLVSQKLEEDEEWVSFQGSDHAVIRAKKLKEISLDELAKMGYKLKEK